MMVYGKVWNSARTDARVFKTPTMALEWMQRLRKDADAKLRMIGTGDVRRYVVTYRTVGLAVPYKR